MIPHDDASLSRIEALLDAVDLDATALTTALRAWLGAVLPARMGRESPLRFEPGRSATRSADPEAPVIFMGAADAPLRLVVTSGLHGVEGRFGLLLQLRFVAALAARGSLPNGVGVVLPFALNAHGFLHARRWCAANSDLNRGFLLDPRASPVPCGGRSLSRSVWDELYARFGPRSPRPTHLGFAVAAARLIALHGLKALLNALPQGQPDHPDFIFHNAPEVLDVAHTKDTFLSLVAGARRVVHVDLHTGYGPRGNADVITPSGPVTRTIGPVVEIYAVAGSFTEWSASALGARGESCVIEFGTEPSLKIFFRLLRENHSFQTGDAARNVIDRRWVLESFFPTDRPWREGALRKGVASLLAAYDGLVASDDLPPRTGA